MSLKHLIKRKIVPPEMHLPQSIKPGYGPGGRQGCMLKLLLIENPGTITVAVIEKIESY